MLKDIQFAARSLTKHPGFTTLAVIILALSISTTSIFSVVNGVQLRPLGFPERERVIVITEINPQQGPEPFDLSYLNRLDLKQHTFLPEEVT